MLRAATVVAVLAVSLAGCIGAPAGDGAASSVVSVARQPGVDDPENVTVHVLDPTGDTNTSVEGARVVFFTRNARTGAAASIWEDPPDCSGGLDEAPYEVLAAATTGPSGRVVGQVRPTEAVETEADWLPVNVAVVGPDGYTKEVFVMAQGGSVPCGMTPIDAGGLYRLDRDVLPVYPSQVELDVNGTVGPTAAAHPHEDVDGRRVWWPRNVHDEPWHLARLDSMEAQLTWSNGGGDWADLYLGFGERDDEPRRTGPDRAQGPADGQAREGLSLPDVGPSYPLLLGPVTDQPVVTADEIGYRITGNLTFSGANVSVPAGPVDG